MVIKNRLIGSKLYKTTKREIIGMQEKPALLSDLPPSLIARFKKTLDATQNHFLKKESNGRNYVGIYKSRDKGLKVFRYRDTNGGALYRELDFSIVVDLHSMYRKGIIGEVELKQRALLQSYNTKSKEFQLVLMSHPGWTLAETNTKQNKSIFEITDEYIDSNLSLLLSNLVLDTLKSKKDIKEKAVIAQMLSTARRSVKFKSFAKKAAQRQRLEIGWVDRTKPEERETEEVDQDGDIEDYSNEVEDTQIQED